MYLAAVTLHKHFGHSGRSAKVAIDLERRMIVEHIVQRRFCKQGNYVFVRQIAFLEPRPKIYYPGAAPTGVSAAGSQPAFERNTCSACQIGRSAKRDLILRVQ